MIQTEIWFMGLPVFLGESGDPYRDKRAKERFERLVRDKLCHPLNLPQQETRHAEAPQHTGDGRPRGEG